MHISISSVYVSSYTIQLSHFKNCVSKSTNQPKPTQFDTINPLIITTAPSFDYSFGKMLISVPPMTNHIHVVFATHDYECLFIVCLCICVCLYDGEWQHNNKRDSNCVATPLSIYTNGINNVGDHNATFVHRAIK